jgi:signal transduction histidine kinase
MKFGIKQKTVLVLVSVVMLTALLHALLAWYFTKRRYEVAAVAQLEAELHVWPNEPSDCAAAMKASVGMPDGPRRIHPRVADMLYPRNVATTQGPGLLRSRPRDIRRTPCLTLALAVPRRSTRQTITPTAFTIAATFASILILSVAAGTLAIGRCLDPVVALAAAVKARTAACGAAARSGTPSSIVFEPLHAIDTRTPGEVGDLVQGFNALLRELARECERRLDERASERTRIARELHDTLLQSFHGVLYRFQAAHNLLPRDSCAAKQTLARGIDAASQAITEARDAVHALRTSTIGGSDLAEALGALGAELAVASEKATGAPRLAIHVEGRWRELHPSVRHEAYRVAAEALRNAFRHAGAERIDVEIRHGDQAFQLLVRDDGRGIAPETLANLPEGHWGLTGMRERAESIAGTLRIRSVVGAGTEIHLAVASRRANARLDDVGESAQRA